MLRLLAVLTLLPLAACETAKGFGRDVENTVSTVEEEVNEL